MARLTKAQMRAPATLPVWRLMAVSAVALTTANCAQNPQKLTAASSGSSYDSKYGVKASPRLYNEGDVIPKGGGRRFSGKPYVVAGRTYVPREDAKGYVREGLASWYGAAFHGRMTANGEVFDRHSIAAAHPTLPLPSYVRVTNVSNGHSMIVRVNDRGPYHANRLMDVSEEVAQALEFHGRGTTKVRVEYVGKASTAGSDDRKLLATLRTDGEPASVHGRSPVMMADLGPDTAPAERLSRAAKPALAFKPEGEDAQPAPEPTEEAAPAPRPVRHSPILMASAASVAVPPALQPSVAAPEAFRPVRNSVVAEAPNRVTLAASRLPRDAEPLALAPPPMRLASAASERGGAARGSSDVSGMNPATLGRSSVAAHSPAGKLQSESRAFASAKPVEPLRAASSARMMVASGGPGRSGGAATLKGTAIKGTAIKGTAIKDLPVRAMAIKGAPTRMAAALPPVGGPAPLHTGGVKGAAASKATATTRFATETAPRVGRLAAHPAPVTAKAVPTKLALASGKPGKPGVVAARSAQGSRRAQVAEVN
ncbi:septal ring lytic transglycosylase RlpA family protein [Methylobacterium sp. BTF04]|uniref:septal ring lytic transglycosylase RlpA family protein n=1 Tax=Methylobacterium sp. BTF04 TaxID=2708300 RepID=UPI001FEE17DF|nr:septal ring lytic transglycosylase RlpA family protein [Methylobacterium sp. BTF04]